MKKKALENINMTISDLAKIIADGFAKTANNFKSIELKIDKIDNYMKEGFETLNEKIDHVDSHISFQIESHGRRIDDMVENKVSNFEYQKLNKRVLALERKVGVGKK